MRIPAFFVKSTGKTPDCPKCGALLKYRDSKLRICRQEGGKKEHLMIRRMKCTGCSSYHNELPDLVAPYKHYQTDVICGVIDEIITPDDEDSEDYPSIYTMLRWMQWFQINIQNMEDYLRSSCCSFFGLGVDMLLSDLSMLEAVRSRYQNWLEKVLCAIYNSGGFLPAIQW